MSSLILIVFFCLTFSQNGFTINMTPIYKGSDEHEYEQQYPSEAEELVPQQSKQYPSETENPVPGQPNQYSSEAGKLLTKQQNCLDEQVKIAENIKTYRMEFIHLLEYTLNRLHNMKEKFESGQPPNIVSEETETANIPRISNNQEYTTFETTVDLAHIEEATTKTYTDTFTAINKDFFFTEVPSTQDFTGTPAPLSDYISSTVTESFEQSIIITNSDTSTVTSLKTFSTDSNTTQETSTNNYIDSSTTSDQVFSSSADNTETLSNIKYIDTSTASNIETPSIDSTSTEETTTNSYIDASTTSYHEFPSSAANTEPSIRIDISTATNIDIFSVDNTQESSFNNYTDTFTPTSPAADTDSTPQPANRIYDTSTATNVIGSLVTIIPEISPNMNLRPIADVFVADITSNKVPFPGNVSVHNENDHDTDSNIKIVIYSDKKKLISTDSCHDGSGSHLLKVLDLYNILCANQKP